MEDNKFFKRAGRINSVLYLLLLVLSICFVIYGFVSSNNWRTHNTVEITENSNSDEQIENLRLSDISTVCGKDIQYIKLNSAPQTKGFSSGGYGNMTRNIVFFAGSDMNSHWLFDTNSYLIDEINQIQKIADDYKEKKQYQYITK